MRILLVEDDALLGDGLASGLAALGFAVDWFRDGAAAGQALGHAPYEAIVLDLSLPGGDGMDWLARWRRQGNTTPVLVLTARDGLDARVAGLDSGADDYLVKPRRWPNWRRGCAAELDDLSIAVWNERGELLLADREGAALPFDPQAAGFVDRVLDGESWRVYYLPGNGRWRVAVGQATEERGELLRDLLASQLLPWLLLPWLLMLPVLLAALAAAVRRCSPTRSTGTAWSNARCPTACRCSMKREPR